MTVLQVCAYGADYAGNFISSLEALEAELVKKGIRTIYAFVGRAAEQESLSAFLRAMTNCSPMFTVTA